MGDGERERLFIALDLVVFCFPFEVGISVLEFSWDMSLSASLMGLILIDVASEIVSGDVLEPSLVSLAVWIFLFLFDLTGMGISGMSLFLELSWFNSSE